MDEKIKKPVPGSFAALMSPTPPVKLEEKKYERKQVKKETKEHVRPKEKTETDKSKHFHLSPTVKEIEKEEPLTKPKSKKVEKRERQLNAWISSIQNETLDKLYFHLRAKGVRVKKGELVGVAIEILSRILENQDSRKIDASILNRYIEKMVKT